MPQNAFFSPVRVRSLGRVMVSKDGASLADFKCCLLPVRGHLGQRTYVFSGHSGLHQPKREYHFNSPGRISGPTFWRVRVRGGSRWNMGPHLGCKGVGGDGTLQQTLCPLPSEGPTSAPAHSDAEGRAGCCPSVKKRKSCPGQRTLGTGGWHGRQVCAVEMAVGVG